MASRAISPRPGRVKLLLLVAMAALVVSVIVGGVVSVWPSNDVSGDPEPVDEGFVSDAVDRLGDLPSIETSLFALGSVWAVTSNRADHFSPDPLVTEVVRIDPKAGRHRR